MTVSDSQRPVAAVFDLDNTITRHGTYAPFVLRIARSRPKAFLYLIPIALLAVGYALRWVRGSTLKSVMLRAVLRNAPRAEVQRHVDAFVSHCVAHNLRPSARAAIDRHRASGDHLILATASFDLYAGALGASLGFDTVVATRVEWDRNGRLTGNMLGPNFRGRDKLQALERRQPGLRERYRVVAYSDHHSDLPLLEWADTGIAVNPTRRLRSIARRRGWQIADWNH